MKREVATKNGPTSTSKPETAKPRAVAATLLWHSWDAPRAWVPKVGSKQHQIPYLTADLGQPLCLSLCVLFFMGCCLQPLQEVNSEKSYPSLPLSAHPCLFLPIHFQFLFFPRWFSLLLLLEKGFPDVKPNDGPHGAARAHFGHSIGQHTVFETFSLLSNTNETFQA